MLQSYFPIYEIALKLSELRSQVEYRKSSSGLWKTHAKRYHDILVMLQRECQNHNFIHASEMVRRAMNVRRAPETSAHLFYELTHLNDSLGAELEREAIFCIPPERKDYFERDDLFGSKVAVAFPSCARDIQKAGSCYALGQEDACVHHLMLVLERGLNALAVKVGVPYQRTNWQNIIGPIETKIKGGMPRGHERDFYLEVNAQFGFLKDAYRNHSEHARDDYYDMPKALSILNHVRSFMQELEKGGLTE